MAKLITPEHRTSLLHAPISKTPVNKDSLEGMTPEKEKKVTGTFINVEYPGQPAKICGRYYKGMQYFSKTFLDGEKAEIPLSVARFINERCHHTKHDNLTDEKGNSIKQDRTFPRYKFMIESY